MTDTITATNAMWDAVKDHVRPGATWDPGPKVGAPNHTDPEWWRRSEGRHTLAAQYAWTITAPDTVAFVAAHAAPALIDPMAGTGWWAHLLTQAGVDVVASDLHPAGSPDNHWHKTATFHHPVAQADGAAAVAAHGAGRALLLAWPPYDTPDGADILAAYPGGRLIFIGESQGGCTGDDRLFDLLNAGWVEVAVHRPVQWYGIHDDITVYDRKPL